MTWATNPTLGTLVLSGCEAVVLHLDNNIVDYIVPGRDTSAIQRPGRLTDRVQLKGIFWSGSDDMKDTLISYIGTTQAFAVPSVVSGNYFFNGFILFEKLSMFQDASKQYPYYEWGIFNARVSGPAIVFSGFQFGIDYSQNTPILGTVTIDYSQDTPVLATVTIDYTQNTPILATATIDYAQMLPLLSQASVSYSKMNSGT